MTKTDQHRFCCVSMYVVLLLICPFLLSSQNGNVREDIVPYVTNKSRPNWLKIKRNQNLKPRQFLNLLNKGRSNEEISNFKEVKKRKNKQGKTKYVYEQRYKGLPIEFHSWVLHEENGRIFLAQGRFLKKPKNRSKQPTLSLDQARIIALDQVKGVQYAWQIPELEQSLKEIEKNPTATYFPGGELLWVALNKRKTIQLAYKFDIYSIEPLARKHVYVNARNGNIIREIDVLHANCFNHTHDHSSSNTECRASTSSHLKNNFTAPFAIGTGQANYVAANDGQVTVHTELDGGEYILKTSDFGPTGSQVIHTQHANSTFNYDNLTEFRDADNIWEVNGSAIAAHWGAQQTYTFFKETFDRNSFDDEGTTIHNLVHYGHNLVNAYWDGSRLIFGDGNGNEWGPLTSLDLIAHEFTHGVTENNGHGGLVYKDESGALNESFSDIFGTVVEFLYHPDGGDWMIGEDFDFATQTGFRNMQDPHLKNHPKTYLGTHWYDSNGDNGGVHFNSGVQNHWFYLLCEGGSGTNEFGHSYDISPIGMEKAAAIAYYNLVTYMTPNSTYQDAKEGAIDAALALYPTDLSIHSTVEAAWCAVGIGEGCGPTIEVDKPALEEVITAGKNYAVNWNSELLSSSSKVKIEYTTDTTDTPLWHFISDNISNSGTYDWMVPSDYSGTVRIKITDDGDPAAGRVSNRDILGTSDAFVIEACIANTSFEAAASAMVDSTLAFSSAIEGSSYEWIIDGTTMATSKDFEYAFEESGIYDITYKVTSAENGCFNEESRRQYVLNPNSSGFTIKVADVENGGGRAYAQEILPTKDGGYLFTTLFTTMVNKFDALGNLLWSSKAFPTPTYGNYRLASLEKEDGNFLIAMGYAESGVSPVSDDLLLIELNGTTGEIINNTSQRLSIPGRLFPHQIIATDTSYLIAGGSESGTEKEVFIAQVKKDDLSIINQHWYGDIDRQDYFGTLATTSDGGFLLGWIQAGSYPEQYVLMKLDATFQQEWKEGLFSYYARPGLRSRMKLLEIPNCEGYMVLASANEYANSALVKLNTLGNVLWAKRYSVPSEDTGQLISFQDLAWDGNDGVTMLGINGTILNSNGYPEAVDYQLLNVGFDGTKNWQRKVTDLRVTLPSNPSYNLTTTKISNTGDGGYLLSIPSGDGGETNLIKTDSIGLDGCAIANTIINEEDITGTFTIELAIQTELDTPPLIEKVTDYSFAETNPSVSVSPANCGIVGRDLIAAFEFEDYTIPINSTPSITNLSRGATDYIWKVNGQVTTLPLSDFTLAGVYTVTLEATDGTLASSTTKRLNVVDGIDCQIACDLEVDRAYTIEATCPNTEDAQIYVSVKSSIGRTFKYHLFDAADSLLATQQTGFYRELAAGDYRVKVIADNDVTCELDLGIMTLSPKVDNTPPKALCTSEAIDIAFVHGAAGIPYGHANYLIEMNNGVGTDWHELTYDKVVADRLFSDSYNYIYLEGSDKSADEMETFLHNHQQLIEDWVAKGNALFINAAPNEGDGMTIGFDGIKLVRGTYTSATAVDPTLPMFVGPKIPVATTFGGTYSLAAVVSPSSLGVTRLLASDNGTDLLVQATWGAGTVMVGGMNLTGFHTPNAEAVNFKSNIHAYLKDLPIATLNSAIPIELGTDQTYTLAIADIDLGSVDDCDIATIHLSQEDFICSDIGVNEVVLTVTDVANNEATCTTKIEIINPSAIAEITATICQGDSYLFDGTELTDEGIYRDTLTNSFDCDSIIVLNLSVNENSQTTIQESICAGTSFAFNGQELTTEGTYRDTLLNALNCDSIVILQLDISPSLETTLAEEICAGTSYSFAGQDLINSGIYRDTLQGSQQCDSIIILDLQVHSHSETMISESICEGATYDFNNQSLADAGVYRDTLQNSNQCDSIIILDLQVHPHSETMIAESICEGATYDFNNQSLSDAGVYRDTLTNSNQCDSIIILDLVVHNNSQTSIMETICQGENFPFNGQSLTEAGVYQATLTNSLQCDSTILLILEIEDCGSCPEDHIIVDGTPVEKGTYTAIKTITSSSTLAADSITFLAGEAILLNPGFYGGAGTSFLGEIAPFICEDPSSALQDSLPATAAQNRVILGNTIDNTPSEQSLTVQPNPFYQNTQLQITLDKPQTIELAIHSVEGQEIQIVHTGILTAGKHAIPYQTSHLNGVYLAVLKTESAVLTQKIISLK